MADLLSDIITALGPSCSIQGEDSLKRRKLLIDIEQYCKDLWAEKNYTVKQTSGFYADLHSALSKCLESSLQFNTGNFHVSNDFILTFDPDCHSFFVWIWDQPPLFFHTFLLVNPSILLCFYLKLQAQLKKGESVWGIVKWDASAGPFFAFDSTRQTKTKFLEIFISKPN